MVSRDPQTRSSLLKRWSIRFQVRVKLINGSEVHVNTIGDKSAVKIGGLYALKAFITSTGSVDVSTFHGAIDVYTSGSSGAVALSSVNGSANVSTGSPSSPIVFFAEYRKVT